MLRRLKEQEEQQTRQLRWEEEPDASTQYWQEKRSTDGCAADTNLGTILSSERDSSMSQTARRLLHKRANCTKTAMEEYILVRADSCLKYQHP